jgi:hypothetical protein
MIVLPSPQLPQLRGSVPLFQTCPHCSMLREGSCVVCEAQDASHPSCRDCEAGVYRPPPPPFWKNDLVVSIGVAVVVSVTSALIIAGIQRYLKR